MMLKKLWCWGWFTVSNLLLVTVVYSKQHGNVANATFSFLGFLKLCLWNIRLFCLWSFCLILEAENGGKEKKTKL